MRMLGGNLSRLIDDGPFAQYAKCDMRQLAFAAALCLLACKPSDPKDPQTWLKQLQDPDPKVRVKAVQGLRKLKARQAAPQVAAQLKDPLVREEAALGLQDLGGPPEVQPLLDAVDTTVGAGSDQAARVTNRTNAKIAEALGNIGDPRAGPTLLRLARASDDYVRLAAVQALGSVHDRAAVAELAHIVDDPAAPPLLIKKAIVSLGQIGDPSAIPALQHGLVLERQGVSFLPESSFALFLIGAPAVEPLMKIAQDQDPAYLSWAKENNRAPAGTYAKSALVLGDLEDPRAVPVLLAKLKYVDPDPVPGTSRLLTNLVKMFAANALGRMRAKEAAPQIQALVTTRDAQDEDLTAFSSEALVWMGDRAQAKELLKKAQSGVLKLRITVAQAAALLGEPALAKDLLALAQKESKGAPQSCGKQLAELGLQSHDPRAACELIASQLSDLAKPLEAAKACGEDPACWQQKLADKPPLVRARAAYELGRSGSPPAVPALVKGAAEEDLMVRQAAIRALDWLTQVPAARPALQAAAAPLAAQLAAEAGKAQYFKVNEDLRRLQVKLSRL
jgi:HEAT repeat protein